MWEWFINSGVAASTLLLGTASAGGIWREGRWGVAGAFEGEVPYRIVYGNPLLVKAGLKTLH